MREQERGEDTHDAHWGERTYIFYRLCFMVICILLSLIPIIMWSVENADSPSGNSITSPAILAWNVMGSVIWGDAIGYTFICVLYSWNWTCAGRYLKRRIEKKHVNTAKDLIEWSCAFKMLQTKMNESVHAKLAGAFSKLIFIVALVLSTVMIIYVTFSKKQHWGYLSDPCTFPSFVSFLVIAFAVML